MASGVLRNDTTSPDTSSRPEPARAATFHSTYHPTQIARASLGDTRGANYLSGSDSPPRLPGTRTRVSMFASLASPSACISPSLSAPDLRLIHATTLPDRIRSDRRSFGKSWSERFCHTTPSSSCHSRTNDGSDTAVYQVGTTKSRMNKFEGYSKMEHVHDDICNRPLSTAPDIEADNTLLNNPERYDGAFLDPFTGRTTSNDRKISESSEISSYLRPNAFAGHRDTLARISWADRNVKSEFDLDNDDSESAALESLSTQATIGLSSHQSGSVLSDTDWDQYDKLPKAIVESIVQYLSFDDYKSARLTCRDWLIALPQPKIRPALRLPREILQQVYYHLEPRDFDSARHTCRSWFLAGLNHTVSRDMVKKAGCQMAHQADVELKQKHLLSSQLARTGENPATHYENIIPGRFGKSLENSREEWLISKRLATECRLSADWHGSGLNSTESHSLSRLELVEAIDFRGLAFQDNHDRIIKRFTVSACGTYLIVISGADIFLYYLHSRNTALKPCVRLVAGKRVLYVSMDTSSGRYTIAALLEGRVGNSSLQHSVPHPQANIQSSDSTATSLLHPNSKSEILPNAVLTPSANHGHQSILADPDDSNVDMVYACASTSLDQQSPQDLSETNSTKGVNRFYTLPVHVIPDAVYEDLGDKDDPPRSVAVCPHKKCVAYGCEFGIGLYWVNATTGITLKRWFPLSAPSDSLYFLPRGPLDKDIKKLRLISSAASPFHQGSSEKGSGPTRWAYSTTIRQHGRHQDVMGLSLGDLPSPTRPNRHAGHIKQAGNEFTENNLSTVDSDHYRAIPLSDGRHMLFVDPSTGLLCIGSNAPVGGPTKLIRKVCMIPPNKEHQTVGPPRCYAVGHDLAWGIRIVAAYRDGSIILYNLPADYFDKVRYLRSSPDVEDELSGRLGQGDLTMDVVMLDNSGYDAMLSDDPLDTASVPAFKSIQVDGAFVYQVDGEVDDMQVDSSHGGLKIWIFQRNGLAQRLNVHTPRDQKVIHATIGVDGLLHSCSNATVDMQDKNMGAARSETGHGSYRDDEPRHVSFRGLDAV